MGISTFTYFIVCRWWFKGDLRWSCIILVGFYFITLRKLIESFSSVLDYVLFGYTAHWYGFYILFSFYNGNIHKAWEILTLQWPVSDWGSEIWDLSPPGSKVSQVISQPLSQLWAHFPDWDARLKRATLCPVPRCAFLPPESPGRVWPGWLEPIRGHEAAVGGNLTNQMPGDSDHTRKHSYKSTHSNNSNSQILSGKAEFGLLAVTKISKIEVSTVLSLFTPNWLVYVTDEYFH